MKRRIIISMTGIGCVAAVAAVALYINMWFLQVQARQEYLLRLQEQVSNLDEEAVERHRNLARWYNYNLENGVREQTAYPSILSFDGDIGWLILPGDCVLPIHHRENPSLWGAVHDPDSAFPLGGAGKHAVLTLTEPPVKSMEPGDIVEVVCLKKTWTYRVESIRHGMEKSTAGTEGLTLVVPGEDASLLIRCLRTEQTEKTGKNEDADISAAAPVMAAVGAALLPAAVCGLIESSKKLRQTSKKRIKR